MKKILFKIVHAFLWCFGWVLIGYAKLVNDEDLLTEDFTDGL